MRLAILSDVHGNLPALEAVLDDLRQREVNGVLVAGDLTGGPQPVETTRLLRSLGSWLIRGNGDSNLLRYASGDAPSGWYTSRQYAMLRWDYRHTDEETLAFIASLPEQRVVEIEGAAPIRVVHGSPRNPSQSIFPNRDPATLNLALAQTNEPVLVCGHTHRPWQAERDGRLALNPGAVCGPLNGDVGAQYAILNWRDGHWRAEHHLVSYNLERIRAVFQKSGLLAEGGVLARMVLLCLETGRDVFEDFLLYAYRLAAEAGFEDCQVVPDEIWEQATATFNWQIPPQKSANHH